MSETFAYVLTRESFIKFNDRAFIRKTLPIYSLIAGVSLLATVFDVILQHEPIWSSTVFFAAVVMIIAFPVTFFCTRRAAVKMYDESGWMDELRTVTFDEKGLAVDQQVGSTRLMWEQVARWLESKDALELWPTRFHAVIFPKDAVTSERIEAIRRHVAATGLARGRVRKRNV